MVNFLFSEYVCVMFLIIILNVALFIDLYITYIFYANNTHQHQNFGWPKYKNAVSWHEHFHVVTNAYWTIVWTEFFLTKV